MELRKYRVILADPPWVYSDTASSGHRGVAYKYPCLKVDTLAKLDIDKITERDSILFLWITQPLLEDGLYLMRKWGFKYKGFAFNWYKKTKNDKAFWGMGNYTRSNMEHVLFGIRGRGVKRVSAAVHSVVEATPAGHSAKPPEVRDRIVQLLGDVPRVELFARDQVPGWDAIGLDIDGQDIRDVLGFVEES